MIKGSNYLGVVETIFEVEEEEEDQEENDINRVKESVLLEDQSNRSSRSNKSLCSPLSSPPLSPPFSSPSTPDLQSALHAWTLATKRRPDVKIYVQDACFLLHKDILTSKSAYLKRHFTEVTEFTLPPQLKITSDTFNLIAQHCYNTDIIVTPFNLAALRTASELLELTITSSRGTGYYKLEEDKEYDLQYCLFQKTESYFCLVVASNNEFLSIVLESSLVLLPEAEEMGFITSRCIEALWGLEEENGCREGSFLYYGIKDMKPEDLGLVLDSLQRRLASDHDLLYRVADLYFKVYTGKITEEQKTVICNSIDCSMLSSQLLLHAVQNPRMPIRFILQAMLIEQLNTHRSIYSVITASTRQNQQPVLPVQSTVPQPPQQQQLPREEENNKNGDGETLGALLQKDTALRQVAKLKAAIDTTSTRIQSLETELVDMRKRLIESEKRNSQLIMLDQTRSISCRFASNKQQETCSGADHHSSTSSNKVGRGERGSKSSSYLRFGQKQNHVIRSSGGVSTGSANLQDHQETPSSRTKISIGERLIKGLKSAFKVST